MHTTPRLPRLEDRRSEKSGDPAFFLEVCRPLGRDVGGPEPAGGKGIVGHTVDFSRGLAKRKRPVSGGFVVAGGLYVRGMQFPSEAW